MNTLLVEQMNNVYGDRKNAFCFSSTFAATQQFILYSEVHWLWFILALPEILQGWCATKFIHSFKLLTASSLVETAPRQLQFGSRKLWRDNFAIQFTIVGTTEVEKTKGHVNILQKYFHLELFPKNLKLQWRHQNCHFYSKFNFILC